MKKYLFRNEGEWAIQHLNLGQKGKDAWNKFVGGLYDSFRWAFEGNVEIVSHELEECEQMIHEKTLQCRTISTDPCIQGDVNLGVSRIFCPGGRTDFGIAERPGFQPLIKQINQIPAGEYTLIEDDIFSGGTIRQIINLIRQRGSVHIKKLIVGIQVGNPNLDIPIEALRTYDTSEIIDLNDPRDFLAGAFGGGLVVRYPWPWCLDGSCSHETKVRVPYAIPFVDTAARSSIPRDRVLEFSRKVWGLNVDFWKNFPGVKVVETERYFNAMALKLRLPSLETRQMSLICQDIQSLLEFPELSFECESKKGMIWIDLNNTLISGSTNKLTIPVDSWKSFIEEAQECGWEIGLCSNSPHKPLKTWGEQHGITGPIIAENGSLINGKLIANGGLNLTRLKCLIDDWIRERSINTLPEVLAPEFTISNLSGSGIAFGAGRISSISLFCLKNGHTDNGLTVELVTFLKRQVGHSLLDYSEKDGFVSIHGDDTENNKGRILRAIGWSLYKNGRGCWMIGDNWNDLTYAPALCSVGIVRGSNKFKRIAPFAERITISPHTRGVVELIRSITGI